MLGVEVVVEARGLLSRARMRLGGDGEVHSPRRLWGAAFTRPFQAFPSLLPTMYDPVEYVYTS